MNAHDVRCGLTSIRGIGAKTAAALADMGITDAPSLLARQPDSDEIRRALTEAGIRGLTPERLDSWFTDAEELVAASDPGPASVVHASTPPDAGRHGEFTIFFDATGSAVDASWSCRVYHDESGDEEEFDGLDTWLSWVADKLSVAVTELLPRTGPRERSTESSDDVHGRTTSSRLQVGGVAVAAAGDGHLVFDVTVLAPVDEEPAGEPLTAHVDLVCLDAAGRVALAESWDEVVLASPHVARRITTGLGLGAYDVRATVTLAVHDESAERSLVLELVP